MFEVQPRPKVFAEGKGKEEEIRGAFDDFILKQMCTRDRPNFFALRVLIL
jgi:hypothetical protein